MVHDHTSILKFIETKFNLGAMTYRDANADNLFDCFDFSNPRFLEPPTLPEPGLPLAGSACQPQPRPPTNPPSAPTTTTTTTSTTTTAPGSGPVPPGAPGGAGGAGAGVPGSSGPAGAVFAPPNFTG